MKKKPVNINLLILLVIIAIPLAFLYGIWVFSIIDYFNPNDPTTFIRIFSIVAAFLITVLFLPISKKFIKVILAIILFTILLSGILLYLYNLLASCVG